MHQTLEQSFAGGTIVMPDFISAPTSSSHSNLLEAMHVVGVGIDLIEVPRIARMLQEHGDRFLNRVFTPAEQLYASSSPIRQVERLAARFAAKEAALKAMNMGLREGITWTDIECVHRADGSPTLQVTGRAAQIAQARGINAWLVSLSHIEHLAAATVTAGRKV